MAPKSASGPHRVSEKSAGVDDRRVPSGPGSVDGPPLESAISPATFGRLRGQRPHGQELPVDYQPSVTAGKFLKHSVRRSSLRTDLQIDCQIFSTSSIGHGTACEPSRPSRAAQTILKE